MKFIFFVNASQGRSVGGYGGLSTPQSSGKVGKKLVILESGKKVVKRRKDKDYAYLTN